MSKKRIIVIGGGAAGMMAALSAAKEGAHVTLLERNEKLGKKIYITGKGRCNVTNAAEGEAFLKAIARNPRFLYASLANFNNSDLMELIESLGVPLKTERGNRVFPVSDHASDITGALQRGMERAGVNVHLNSRVKELQVRDVTCVGVVMEDGSVIAADSVIVCTGGISYPTTGSTGDGHEFAKAVGHSVTSLLPALVPVETMESWPALLTGLSLKNVALKAWTEKKKKPFYNEQGEMLFTHFGISGPLVLTLSSYLPEDLSGVRLEIDLKPALDMQMLDMRLLRDFKEHIHKRIGTVMDGLAPHNLAQQILILAGIPAQTPIDSVTAVQRADLVRLIKGLPLTIKSRRGFNEAIITRGGVNVKEIDPSSMASKLISGLYFAGELIDVDGQTGGYNLQIAFSTGALAGKSAAYC